MTRVKDLHRGWMKNPKYKAEYEAMDEEFQLARTLIEARMHAGLSQTQVARRMKSAGHGEVGLFFRFAWKLLQRLFPGFEKGFQRFFHPVHFLAGKFFLLGSKLGNSAGNGSKQAFSSKILNLEIGQFFKFA